MNQINQEVATQVAQPVQAAKRTGFQILSGVVVAPVVLFAVSESITIFSQMFGDKLDVNLNDNLGILAAGVTAAGVTIARIMAIPSVNNLLTKVGLGAESKKSIEAAEEVYPTAGGSLIEAPAVEAPVQNVGKHGVVVPQEEIEELKQIVSDYENGVG